MDYFRVWHHSFELGETKSVAWAKIIPSRQHHHGMIRRLFNLVSHLGNELNHLYSQGLMFIPFAYLRFMIANTRARLRSLESQEVWLAHFPVYTLIAVAEMILTIFILYVVINQIRSETDMSARHATHKHLFRSSVFILLVVDLIGICLAITSVLNKPTTKEESPNPLAGIMQPFLGLKCAFALVSFCSVD